MNSAHDVITAVISKHTFPVDCATIINVITVIIYNITSQRASTKSLTNISHSAQTFIEPDWELSK